MKYYFSLILFLLLEMFCISKVLGQSIVINEWMADNTTTYQDEDGDYSDWIELYNKSDVDANLEGYHLSDDFLDLNKWTFPNIIIPADSFLLIFASDKNRLNPGELHTNFKIASSGEPLYLSNELGLIIDQTNQVTMDQDEAYGRLPDGSNNLVSLSPSPGVSNNLSNQLSFFQEGGFYKKPFYAKISSAVGDTIFYTTDGSMPTANDSFLIDSLFLEYKYLSPNVVSEIRTTPEQALIGYKAWVRPDFILDKATVLRCASFRNGIRTSKVYTQSYFIDSLIYEKYNLPIISLVTDNKNLFDPDSGIYVPGVHYDTTNSEWSGNYFQKGVDWERPVHIEYYEKGGTKGFAQDAGFRIHGGKTRQASQKSLRIYAREEYGPKYFNYNLFPQKDHQEYKRFLLRTTMGSWFSQNIIKDVLAHEIVRDLDVEYQDFRPVVVFINGEYWGIQTIRDYIDERYIAYTHNLDKDSVDIKESGNEHYQNLIYFISNNDLSNNANCEYVKTQVDINNYIDYMIAEMFFNNHDWPVNNIKLWRPKHPDGKWRWIFYDLDGAFGNYEYNMFEHSTETDPNIVWPNSPWSTFLFRNFLKNGQFRTAFIERYTVLLYEDFDRNRMSRKLEEVKGLYASEIPRHISRWQFPDSFSSWENDVNEELSRFLENRSCTVSENITLFFDLPHFGFSCDLIRVC